MKNFNGNEFVNIGTGVDVSIAELSEMIAGIVGFYRRNSFDEQNLMAHTAKNYPIFPNCGRRDGLRLFHSMLDWWKRFGGLRGSCKQVE